jgi:hypothetical protein
MTHLSHQLMIESTVDGADCTNTMYHFNAILVHQRRDNGSVGHNNARCVVADIALELHYHRHQQ